MTGLRIDALRGLAALGVVLYHVRTELWVGWCAIRAHPQDFSTMDEMLAYLGLPMRFMGGGVLLFFVLSGFCIHRPQAEKAANLADADKVRAPGWPRFLLRRFLRIYPPYLAALIFSGAALLVIGDAGREDLVRWLSSALMVQNYVPPGGQVMTNPSLWSLPVEMELYLIYPLFWWVGTRVGWGWMMGLATAVSTVALAMSVCGVRWLDGSFPRFWLVWCAGAWVANRLSQKKLPKWSLRWAFILVGTLAAACLSEFLPSALAESSTMLLWGAVGVVALIWACADESEGTKPEGTWILRILAKVGVISYSLYLVHYPIFFIAGHWWRTWFGAKPSSLAVPMAWVLFAIGAAWLFYVLIERPSHLLARKLGQERRHQGEDSRRVGIKRRVAEEREGHQDMSDKVCAPSDSARIE
jgi:peptidoglycan/LPS O-acetylase OafA/YrhL